MELTRADVISVLGPPTWAALPRDKGEFRAQGEDALGRPTAVDLYWKNGNCEPIMVSLSVDMKVIGSGDGRHCFGMNVDPDASYACTRADRKKYCK